VSETRISFEDIEADVKRQYEAFDKQRQTLIAAFQRAKTTKTRLQALAKIVRQHGEYVNRGMLSGWQTRAVLHFADVIDDIADGL
jgi:hypothetical protein